MKKTIVHVIDSLGIGGAEVLLRNTLSVLPQYRHIVCYLAPPDDLVKTLNADKVYFLDFRSNYDGFKCVIKLKNILMSEKAVLVHAHLLRSTWISRWASWRKCPLVFTVHNFLSEDAFKVNRLSYYLEKLTYRKAQTLIAVSVAALDDYKKWIGVKGNTHVLYNMINQNFFDQSIVSCEPSSQIRLVAVGNLRRQKNYQTLVKAFLHLKTENVSLDIYGRGELYKELEEQIREHKLPIRLMGQVNDIPHVLKNYDGFILASLFEGYGIAPVEAMAIGLPLLLSDLQVFREVTNNEAVFFNPSLSEEIAGAIKEFILISSEKKTFMSRQGKIRAMNMASKDRFQQKLAEIYQSIIN